jgi:streptogramin lyase
MHTQRRFAALAIAALIVPAAAAGVLTGIVTGPDGKPVPGAMVTLTDAARGLGESAYSGADGRYRLDTRLAGALDLRVRRAYLADQRQSVELPDGTLELSIRLEALRSDQEISDALPAAYHFGQIPFEEGTLFERHQFQRDCLTCHQLGNNFTRHKRDAAGWLETVKRMHSWLGSFDEALRAHRSELLAKGFDDRPIAVRPVFPADPSLARAKVIQYRLDKGVVPHDAEVNPNDGLVYTVDQGADHIAITDLASAQTRYVPAPAAGSPPGGKFVKMGQPPLFNMLMARGPHSMAFGPDGLIYTTDAFAGEIGVFNPKAMAWGPPLPLPGDSLYPHTIRFDREGYAWFTIAYSDEIGRLDPRTGKIDVLTPPPGQSKGIAGLTVPYGIDVHPKDGTIWYSRLFADRIGRIDPKTLAFTEFDSPVRGPRRMRFDAAGALWITGFADGELARVETDGFKSKVYRLPQFADGYFPAPYALGVHPQTQDVWVNEIMTDHLYRFIPKEERWVAYPMPLRGTYTRDMSFTRDGWACTSNNPIPAAALEGGVTELICVDADAGSAATAVAARK